MGTAIAAILARLRIVVDDAALAYWTDAELTEHINRALRELSHDIPRQQKTTIATTPASRDISLTTLTDRISVEAVEYKTGAWPETFVNFRVWGDTLTILDDPIPDGANAVIYWGALHVINGTKSLPTDDDETLLFLAASMAYEQQQADSANALNTGGPAAPRDWSSLASRFYDKYRARAASRRGVRQTTMRGQPAPAPSQSTDPGP